MRFFTKLVAFSAVLTVLLHYYCELHGCSAELGQLCHYTSPVTVSEMLAEKNGFLRDTVHPRVMDLHEAYSVQFKPKVVEFIDFCAGKVYARYQNLDLKPFQKHVTQQKNYWSLKCSMYYNITLRPLWYRFQVYTGMDKLQLKMKPVCEKIKYKMPSNLYELPFNFVTSLKSKVFEYAAVLQKTAQDSTVLEGIKNGAFEKRDEDIIYTASTTSSSTSSSTTKSTSTVTSTLFRTVTVEDAEATAEQTENEDSLPVKKLLKTWRKKLNKRNAEILKSLDDDSAELINSSISSVDTALKQKVQDLTNELQEEFQKISNAILDINATSTVDEESGETVLTRLSDNKRVDTFMSRELMREYFNETRTNLESSLNSIGDELVEFIDDMESKVNELRSDYFSTYDSWSNSLLEKWSEKLNEKDIDKNEEIEKGLWKQFLNLKKHLSKQKKQMSEYKPNLEQLGNFTQTVQNALQIINKEAGEYLYILRARANLAFQEREKLERENKGEHDGSLESKSEAKPQEKEPPVDGMKREKQEDVPRQPNVPVESCTSSTKLKVQNVDEPSPRQSNASVKSCTSSTKLKVQDVDEPSPRQNKENSSSN